jgi:hypothetical protein
MHDWMDLHPAASPTDSYYLQLCNKTLKIILGSELKDTCGSAERAIRQACILVAYFEDVISETGLFRTFNERYRALYGNGYLPFYDTTSDYYPDEINLHDIHFLVWHSLSLWRLEDGGGLVNPFFRDSISVALEAVYDMFDREFEHAPQNENIQEFMRLPPRSDVDGIRKRLNFIVSQSYLNVIEHSAFIDRILKDMEKESFEKDEDEDEDIAEYLEKQEAQFYDACVDRMFNHCSSLLAQHACEELAALAGEAHPQYQLLKSLSGRRMGCFLYLKENTAEMIFEHLPSQTRVNVSKEYLTIQSEQLSPKGSCMAMGIVKWGNVWQQMGSAVVFDYQEHQDRNWPGASAFDDEETKETILKNMYGHFLQANDGKPAVIIKNMEDWYDFYGRFLDRHLEKAGEQKMEMKETLLSEAVRFVERENLPITFFFNPKGGMEFYYDIAAVPGNDGFEPEEKIPLEDFFIESFYSKEFVDYLIDTRLIETVSSFESEMDAAVILANHDFLMRYYKQKNYWTRPCVSVATEN